MPDLEPQLSDHETERAHRSHDSHNELVRIAHQFTVRSGESALKAIFLINGGAAVAVLAFVGGLAGQGRVPLKNLTRFTDSLSYFAYGVFLATLATGIAYLANYSHASFLANFEYRYTYPYSVQTDKSNTWKKTFYFYTIVSVILFFSSAILFFLGVISIKNAVVKIGTLGIVGSLLSVLGF